MDVNEIKEIIGMYFDASFESDGKKMETVFHQQAHIYGHGDNGSLKDMDRETFLKLVESSPPDGAPGSYTRQDEILSIDFTGENTAVARLKIRVGNTLYTDVLNFIRLNGRWCVICKLFSGQSIG